MHTLKIRSVFNAAINKNIIRTAAVINTTFTENVSKKRLKSFNEIPGPSSLPFIGSSLHQLPGGKLAGYKGVKFTERLHQLYGQDGIVRVGGFAGAPDMVFLFDPDAMEYVLRSENTKPYRPGFASLEYYRHRYNKTIDPQRQTGLLTDHGEKWKKFRTEVNQILLQPKTIKLYTDVLDEVSNDMIEKMRSVRDENNMIKEKLDVVMNLWALESISVVALGTRLNCFDQNLPKDSPARRLIQNIHDFLGIAVKLDFGASPWRFFATPMFKKAMKVYEEQENLAKHFIDQAVKKMEETKNKLQSSDSEKAVLEKLLEIDVRTARIMASDLIFGGVDTTSNTGIATLYLLATHPERQNKLRAEVLSKTSQKSYLKACIKESTRMMPVVNGNARQVTKEYDLLGYRIPKHTLVVFPHPYLSIMEKYFPKSNEFIPERWLAEKHDPVYHGNAHRFVALPFGYGVRMCIGRRIAELQTEIFISKAIENFQIEWAGDEPIQVKSMSLNYLTGPYNFIFKDL